jgi:hypothetical protein
MQITNYFFADILSETTAAHPRSDLLGIADK